MNLIFLELFHKIYPFYFLILAGWGMGRYLDVDNKSTVNILFYMIVPVVFFESGYTIEIKADYFALPVILLLISFFMNRLFLAIGQKVWETGSKPAVISFAAGTANTGYFGLPVAMMLFDDKTVAVYMLMNIGLSFYDYTLGAFTFARSQFSRNKAIISVIKLPILYAFFAGLLLQSIEFSIPDNIEYFFDYFRGTYVILGMTLLGLAMSKIQSFKLDIKLTSMLLASRFLVAPAIMLTLIYIDTNYSRLFDRDIHMALLLTSIVPPAINTVVFATIHHANPEETSAAILAGTVLGVLYLPIMVALIF